MQKKINKLMKDNNFVLVRSKRHNVWQNLESGFLITTSKTPSDVNVYYAVKRNIRKFKNYNERRNIYGS